MMDTVKVRMTNLFEQLGLDSSEQEIANFIKNHPLQAGVSIVDAPFWNDSQRNILKEMLMANARWTGIVEQLNEALHS